MRDIILDLTPFEEKISLHRYLKETLDFPFYYGANLDALHDVLTDCREKTVIALADLPILEEHLGDYAVYLLRVLNDCAQDNPHIRVLK